MFDMQFTSPRAAMEPVARHMLDVGVRFEQCDREFVKLTSPMVLSFVNPADACPGYVCLGNPYQHLVSSFVWLVGPVESTSLPKNLMPSGQLPDGKIVGQLAAKLVSEGRCPFMGGEVLSTFETSGLPGEHALSPLNMVFSLGGVFEALTSSFIRWSFLHQSLCACASIMQGEVRAFILHPVAPVDLCEAILAEYKLRTLQSDSSGLQLGLITGDYDAWRGDAAMFASEHCLALGYNDRFIKGVLVPAVSSWMALTDPDAADRVPLAMSRAKEIVDSRWRSLIIRFLETQEG